MTTKKKNQKPTEYDLHLKYLCNRCGQEHWLSLREASTKDYKVVCFCDNVFTVKAVEKIKIKYATEEPVIQTNVDHHTKTDVEQQIINNPVLSPSLYNSATKLLITYGFTKAEANEMVTAAYAKNPVDDYKILVQTILNSLEVTDGNQHN
jgi:hypothetical protein